MEATLLDGTGVSDEALETLLREVYVGGGFTPPDVAQSLFAAAAVRARGRLIAARDDQGALLGMILVVSPDSPARRLAAPDEAELHLLAVRETRRGTGLGRRLVERALEEVRAMGLRRVVLWTQPSMLAAQRLYARCGFARAPERDFAREGRPFLVYEHTREK